MPARAVPLEIVEVAAPWDMHLDKCSSMSTAELLFVKELGPAFRQCG